ncbi:MAG: pyruvoyl-dependent arginine decarboxylase [Methermicoccaceae archaeon]
MKQIVPERVFYTSGIGTHESKLASFEIALRDAGVHILNLVGVSSVLPPNCTFISKEEGLAELEPGGVTFCVLSETSSCQRGERVFVCVACAHPSDEGMHGYFAEHHSSVDEKEGLAVASALASELYSSLTGEQPSRLTSVHRTGVVEREGEYLTAVAMAVFM